MTPDARLLTVRASVAKMREHAAAIERQADELAAIGANYAASAARQIARRIRQDADNLDAGATDLQMPA